MPDTNDATDQELIHASEASLQALHTYANEREDAELTNLLETHHQDLLACLVRYNTVYAPDDGRVALRSGGGKEDGSDGGTGDGGDDGDTGTGG